MKRALFAVAAVTLSAHLRAQSFNIDFGDPASGPSPTYAAAGLPGYWNAILGDTSTYYTLNDLSGTPSSVVLWQTGAAGSISESDPSVSGDDAALLDDGLITYTQGVDSCFFFSGLQPGTYELLTYAWRPNHPTEQAKSFVDNTPGIEITGGAWPGHHVHGVTYARHIVTVDSGGTMWAHSGLAVGADTSVGAVCNGMQLRRIDAYPTFCSGDGTGMTCPCANPGSQLEGCDNRQSGGTGGAFMTGSGAASLGGDTLSLDISSTLDHVHVLFEGSGSISDTRYGAGVRCVGGGTNGSGQSFLKRLAKGTPSGGAISFGGLSQASSAKGAPLFAGETYYYFAAYRNTEMNGAPGCAGLLFGFNATNACAVTWVP
jgi:hypothetical protein